MDGAAPEPAVSGAVPGMNRPVALYFIVFYFLTCICLLGVIYTYASMHPCMHAFIHSFIGITCKSL